MFEKEAEEYANGKGHEHYNYLFEENAGTPADFARRCFEDGAEFGYNKYKEELNQKGLALQSDMDKTIEQNIVLKKELNKVKEWNYVKDRGYPKKTGVYLVAWKRTHHVEEYGKWGFDVDFFNAYKGYFEWARDSVIAWKEITLPKKE